MSKAGGTCAYNFGPRDLSLIDPKVSDEKFLKPTGQDHLKMSPKIMMEIPSPPKMF
jgi:hypothetical protein